MSRTLFAVLVVCSVACAHAKKPEAPVSEVNLPAAKPAEKPQLQAQVQQTADASQSDQDAARELQAALATLQNSTVLFGTDDATLTQDGRDKLAAVGNILAKHPKLAIRVEGNCDERGTEDYNIALGQKRASVAKNYLLTMGAGDKQVGTVSYGEEKPKVSGHDEASWSQNRRDDIVVTSGAN